VKGGWCDIGAMRRDVVPWLASGRTSPGSWLPKGTDPSIGRPGLIRPFFALCLRRRHPSDKLSLLGIERHAEGNLIVRLAYWSDWHEATAPQDKSLVKPIKEPPAVSMGA
jgi:hypothetical protein